MESHKSKEIEKKASHAPALCQQVVSNRLWAARKGLEKTETLECGSWQALK